MRERNRRVMLSIALIGLLALVVGVGTFSAFSSTTSNGGNVFTAGSVELTDNDVGSAMYSVSGAVPGTSDTSCITVTYSGSLDADVVLYTASTIDTLGSHLNLTITPGTGPADFVTCAGWTASGAAIFDGTLAQFASENPDYAGGLALGTWQMNDAVVYRFDIELPSDDTTGEGLTTGTHAFTWEARNT